MSELLDTLEKENTFIVQQRHEFIELVGYETRNKYEIMNENQDCIGFAAEQQKGFWNFLVRQFLGHWRSFEVLIFDSHRQLNLRCRHPFRFLFNRFNVYDKDGKYLGALEQRFSILKKRFDVLNSRDQVVLEMSSPIYRIWTFFFYRRGVEVAKVEKKWSGLLSEAFTDKDNFKLSLANSDIDSDTKAILLSSAIFIDLMYFERKAN